MIASMIRLAIARHWAVLVVAVVVMAVGVYAFTLQPIDAYPDISGQQVQVIATYPGRSPEQVEREVTVPIERAMRTVPRITAVRSRTIFGLAVVQVVFEEGVENYWARQRVSEQMHNANLPDGADADMAPLANGYGEVLRYEIVGDGSQSLFDLRELNDWVITPRLLRVEGVADVNNFGGLVKQFTVSFRPAELERYALKASDVADALKANNSSSGGGVVQRGAMSYVVRGGGSVETLGQIENTFVKSIGGTPVYLRDVATVALDAKPPLGIFSSNLRDASVEGIVIMRRGENPSKVLEGVKAAIEELNSQALPKGVQMATLLDRSRLVDSTLETVGHSVGLGITLVVLVLLLFLGRPMMAALVALTVPFSLLFALVLMYLTGIPIGLLSIGAIDFGIIVDGAIIMAENIARRLGEATHRGEKIDAVKEVMAAALEVERPVFFSVIMIVVAYLPLLTLSSIEGLLFRPMAITMVYALGGALLFALLVVPALAVILFRNGYHEWENPLLTLVRPLYALIVRGLLACRWLALGACVCGMAFVILRVAPHLGLEFLPYMDEGVVWVRANFPEGTSLDENNLQCRKIREIALSYKDIKLVTVQSGRNDSGTDPYPPSRNEIGIIPKPMRDWTQFKTKRDLVTSLSAQLRDEFPTVRFNFTQPIIDGVTEDTNGTSANLAVEFSGPDSYTMLSLATRTVDLLKQVPGAQDVNIEQEGPQPQLVVTPDRALCARFGVRIEDVTKLINSTLGGEPVGVVYEGERKFDIAAKFDRKSAGSPAAVARLPVGGGGDSPAVALGSVAKIELADGQTIIARENGRRRMTVRADIVGRDQAGFVADAQARFEKEIRPNVPADVRIGWLGMFENLERAKKHFLVVIPITVVLIFGLLLVTFGSLRAALLLLLSVPFAFTGGIVALAARDMHLNVSTGVGFAALFGVSIMNGVLMVRAITDLRRGGMARRDAVVQGALDCLRPIVLASLVAILGLLPASLASGLGSDVQRPLATVIVWGLVSSTILTLFIVPVLYEVFAPPVPRAETTTG